MNKQVLKLELSTSVVYQCYICEDTSQFYMTGLIANCVFLFTENLQVDVLKLQKENLVLEQEKLKLQISLLKQYLHK